MAPDLTHDLSSLSLDWTHSTIPLQQSHLIPPNLTSPSPYDDQRVIPPFHLSTHSLTRLHPPRTPSSTSVHYSVRRPTAGLTHYSLHCIALHSLAHSPFILLHSLTPSPPTPSPRIPTPFPSFRLPNGLFPPSLPLPSPSPLPSPFSSPLSLPASRLASPLASLSTSLLHLHLLLRPHLPSPLPPHTSTPQPQCPRLPSGNPEVRPRPRSQPAHRRLTPKPFSAATKPSPRQSTKSASSPPWPPWREQAR